MTVPPELYRLLVRFAEDCGRSPEDCLWSSLLNGMTLSLGRALELRDSDDWALLRDIERTAHRYAQQSRMAAYHAAVRDVPAPVLTHEDDDLSQSIVADHFGPRREP